MKVLLVVSSYLPNIGGLQRVTSRLAAALIARGYPTTVLAQRYPRSLAAREEVEGVRVRRLLFLVPRLQALLSGRPALFLAGFVHGPLTLARVLALLIRERPAVVHLHFLGAPAVFLLLARTLLRFRFVVSLHGDDVAGLARGTPFDRWIFRATLRRADAVTACSHALLAQAQVAAPGLPRGARVVYNGVDAALPSEPAGPPGASLGVGGGLLAVGRLVPKKGFDVLLCALAGAASGEPAEPGGPVGAASRRDRPPLLLIGDGPERARLQTLARELGLDARVTFAGSQDAATVAAALAASRLVVVPSREEPFGLVALEALAAGKPVVASRVDGLIEVLAGADAVTVAPDDPAALAAGLAAALARLGCDPCFGLRNRELAARFSTQAMVDGYAAVYAGAAAPAD